MRTLKAVFVGLLIAVGVTVFVIGATHTPPPPPPGRTVIQYWEKWTGDEGVAMQGIVDDFNATVGKEKNIYVQWVNMSSIDQKTMVAIAGGVPPDVAGLWDTQLDDFAAANALEPLDELAAAHGIGPQTYKPIFWKACTSYKNHLWGLISTPASVALFYNKQSFIDHAADLRAAGLDPDRPPQTLDELDKYAYALTTFQPGGTGSERRIKASGFLPMEPGWYVTVMAYWFGGELFDPASRQLLLNSPANVRAFDWMAGYAKQYGKDAVTEFHSGVSNFASAENPFFTGNSAMVQQGPWMANFMENLAPKMNRWHVSPEKLQREKDFDKLTDGMSRQDVTTLLGEGVADAKDPLTFTWDAGIKTIDITFDASGHLVNKQMQYIPATERQKLTQWGAVPFPSAIPGLKDVTYCPYDVLVIPRGSKHKAEAFEFLAYVTRQDVMEKLCSEHCKNSPLRNVSEHFIKYHPNPYIQVFDDLANSPNAHTVPPIPIWPAVNDELTVASQKCYLLTQTPQQALDQAQNRCDARWSNFEKIQTMRGEGNP